MTARPMTEVEYAEAIAAAQRIVDTYDAFVNSNVSEGRAQSDYVGARREAPTVARALLSTSSAVRGMREALESIRYHSENQDMSHRTFRIKARECADAALSVEEEEQATRGDDAATAPTDRL